MRAIDRTTKLFVEAVRLATPCASVSIDRSVTKFGRSTYVHIRSTDGNLYRKVRISDHPVGMRRATSGQEDLYLHARAKPHNWSVWLGELRRAMIGDTIPPPHSGADIAPSP